jgi:SAM-dependent methyltransferase
MIVGFFPATTMPDAEWWQALWPDAAKVPIEMGVQPGTVVVDLCCGDGLFTAALAHIADSVYAVDIDAAMLDRARALVAATGATNCHFVLADAMTFRCGGAGAGRLRFSRKHLPRRPGSAGLGASRRGNPQTQGAIRGRQLASSSS